MKRLTILFAVLAVFLWVGSAWATNITIYDNRSGTYNESDGNGWWTQTSEDQEVEPHMSHNQTWDLEGFFLDGTMLSMVGGFNFKEGNYGYTSGDIFLDIDGDARFGDENPLAGGSLRNGYDYVIDLIFGTNKTGAYNVYEIYDTTILKDVMDYNKPESSPWQYYHNENSSDTSIASGSFTFNSGLTDTQTGFSGGSHYSVTGIDLSFLAAGTDFTSHFTMECGNDNLMGHGSVPEPATMLLFGTGLIGMAVIGRKKFLKKQG